MIIGSMIKLRQSFQVFDWRPKASLKIDSRNQCCGICTKGVQGKGVQALPRCSTSVKRDLL
jgi:hypothetical protein